MSDVVQIPVPPRAEELAGLTRIDYADAFSVAVPVQRRPEEWLRVAGSLSPTVMRGVRGVQRGLGLRLAPPGTPDHPVGWTILHSTDEVGMLGAEGSLVTPRVVAFTPPGKIVVATLLRYDNVLGRPLWAVVSPVHRAVARHLLDRMRTVALEHQTTQ